MTELEKALLENRRMREALEFIIAWQLPKVRDTRIGKLVSYSYSFGSNGERDYMKNVAAKAIKNVM